jgi:acyl carrier protein
MNIEEVMDRVTAFLHDELPAPAPDVAMQTSLASDLHFDDLMLVELVLWAEDEFELDISDEDCEPWKTVGDVVTYLVKATEPS